MKRIGLLSDLVRSRLLAIGAAVVSSFLSSACVDGAQDTGNAESHSSSAVTGPSFVQIAAATPQQPLQSVSVAFSRTEQAGDSNLLVVGWNDTVRSVSSVTDSNGNSYTLAAPVTRHGSISQSIYYASNIRSTASNTVTVSFDGAAKAVDLRAVEYAGLTNVIDAVNSASGTSSQASTSTLSVSGSRDVVFAAGTTSWAFSRAGTGFSLRIITSPDSDIVEDLFTTQPGSYTATAPLSTSADWVLQAVVLRAATGGSSDAGADARASDSGAAKDASDAGSDGAARPDADAGGRAEAGADTGARNDAGSARSDAGSPSSDAGSSSPPPSSGPFTYPLKPSSNGRYLVDQGNRPFLLAGDAPQCLTVNASVADATFYFQTRAAQGFNAAWINLLCTTYSRLLFDYNRTSFLPNVMIEANYEGEQLMIPRPASALDVRTQFYWSDLSGATGSFYGSRQVDFVDSNSPGWKWQVQNAPGGLEFQYVQKLFMPRRWYDLVPDQNHAVVTSGLGNCDFSDSNDAQGNDCATTARTADGTLVISYMPTARTITVDMTKLATTANAQWYDPTNGAYTPIGAIANTGTRNFTPPAGPHGDGASDWVLVLETGTPPANAAAAASPASTSP